MVTTPNQILVTLPNEIRGEVTGGPSPRNFGGGHRQKVTPSQKMMVTPLPTHRLSKFICCVQARQKP